MSSVAGRIAALDRALATRERTHPGALVAALLLHGVLFSALLLAARPEPPKTPVLDLSLAFPAPVAPSPAAAEAPVSEAFPEEEPLAPASASEAVPPPPVPDPVPESPPEPPEPAEARADEQQPPPEPPPDVAPLPEPPPPPPPPPPQPVLQPRAQRQTERRPSQPRMAPTEASGGGPVAHVPAEAGAPAADPAVVAAGLAEYRAALLRILRANHRYPRAAEIRGDQGTVVVRFAVARDGRVLAPHVERGSGHAALDEEAEALLRRVSPLPPLPAAVPQAQLELVLPITFRLR